MLLEATLRERATLGRHEKAVAELLGEGLGVCAIAKRLGIPLSSAHKVIKPLKD